VFNSRIEGSDIQLSQGVSQSTGVVAVPLADDMMQTQRMTIENLIEATEVIYRPFIYVNIIV
jgi:hypothetical protein